MPNARRFLGSWLEQAMDEFPQAKATGAQILAALKKNPKVSMEEIRDRGFDKYLTDVEGVLRTEDAQNWLAYHPMQLGEKVDPFNTLGDEAKDYSDWRSKSIPLGAYKENVTAFPDLEPRSGISTHYDTPGYAWHSRGGISSNPDLGFIQDELQRDSSRLVTKNFNPDAEWTKITPEEIRSADTMSATIQRNIEGAGLEDIHRMVYAPGYTGRYWERPFNSDLGDAQQMVQQYMDELPANTDDAVFRRYALQDLMERNAGVQATAPGLEEPFNTPGRTRWTWNETAKNLVDASNAGQEYFSWPAAEQQYKRYYQRSPDALRAELEAGWPAREASLVRNNWSPEAIDMQRQNAFKAADKAARDQQFYQNMYDRDLPQDKRWGQMGVTPELYTDPKRGEKFWRVPLANLPQQIPYYGIGGAAALGALDEEDYSQYPGGYLF